MDNGDIGNRVAEAVLRKYASLPKKGKPQASEMTAMAGIALTTPASSPEESPSLHVITIATGTKCVGGSIVAHAQGRVVSDCHAEVLARRALLRWLHAQVRECLLAPNFKPGIVFKRCDDSNQLQLLPGVQFHLYCSQAPCGDASIFVQDGTSQVRTGGKLVTVRVGASRSEAQAAERQAAVGSHGGLNVTEESEDDVWQAVGVLRRKPGRGDSTMSMSCSDKIALWTVTGLQGSLLSHYVAHPIYLTSVTVAAHATAEGPGLLTQQAALHRALVGRLEHSEMPEMTLHWQKPLLFIVPPPPLSLARSSCPSNAIICGFSIIWSDCGLYEVLVGATGRKQGSSRLAISPATQSSICRQALLKLFFELEASLVGHGEGVDPPSYVTVKEMGQNNVRKIRFLTNEESPFFGWLRKPRDFGDFRMHEQN